MKKVIRSTVALTLAWQLPLLSFAQTSLSADSMRRAVESSRLKARQDLVSINQSLLQFQNSMVTLKNQMNENADGAATRYFKIGTTVTSSVLIIGGLLALTKPKLIKPEVAFGYAWLGSTVALANSLVTIFGSGSIRDWNTSEILKAKDQNAQLLSLVQDSLKNEDLDNSSREQLMTLQKLSSDLARVLEKEDQTVVDKADKALAALHLVAFVWGFIDRNNMASVQIGKNFYDYAAIEAAVTISIAVMKNITGWSLILNPSDLKQVNASLDLTLENIDTARMNLQNQISSGAQ